MDTRRSARNQEILWRALGREGAPPTPTKTVPAWYTMTDADIDAAWRFSSATTRASLKRDAANYRRKLAAKRG